MQSFPLDTPPNNDIDTVGVRLLADGPVARAKSADGPELWLALSQDTVRQALSDPRFSRAAAAGPGATGLVSAADPDKLISMDPPKHTRVRRLMARAFSPRMVDRLASRVRGIVTGLLDEIEAHGRPADLVGLLAEPLPIIVICELLGVPDADRAAIRGWSTRLLALTAYPPEEISTAIDQITEYLVDLVATKRMYPGDDLTTALIQVADDGEELTETELVANLQLLLVAGHETTVNQIGNFLVALFRHPDQLRLLRDRPELIGSAVEELMRYVRLVSDVLPRVAVADVELGGQVVAAGEVVIPLIGAANQDSTVFSAPDRLDITRADSSRHVGFGHGPHYCLGAHLARLELRTVLSSLLARFPGLALAIDESELVWREGTPIRALRALAVTW